jgi:far upstream element-binding protein
MHLLSILYLNGWQIYSGYLHLQYYFLITIITEIHFLIVGLSEFISYIMQNNPAAFQDAIARAKQIAQKLTATAPNANLNSSLKRPNSEDDSSNKRPAFTSPTSTNDIPAPVLRAQQVAQQINSQLGVKTSSDPLSLPLSNQLTFQEDYKIPDKFVGLVIGKGGEQIVRLQAESGCKVTICQTRAEPVPGGPNPPDRLANLCGTREAIERAKRIMDDIVLKGRMAEGGPITLNPYSIGGTNSKSIDVLLPSAKCGLVIGKGGENIKRVSVRY